MDSSFACSSVATSLSMLHHASLPGFLVRHTYLHHASFGCDYSRASVASLAMLHFEQLAGDSFIQMFVLI